MLGFYFTFLDSDEERNIFELRYEQYKHECLRYADSILQDKFLAEDAVHEAFMQIAKHREKYLPLSCSDFHRSIVIIVRNICFNMRKRRSRETDYPSDDDVFNADKSIQSAEDYVLHKEDIREQSNYLNQIDELSRHILHLKYGLGMTYKEISAELDMKQKTIEQRVMRAKTKLRNMLTKGGGNND